MHIKILPERWYLSFVRLVFTSFFVPGGVSLTGQRHPVVDGATLIKAVVA